MPPDQPIYAWAFGSRLLRPSTFYFLPTPLHEDMRAVLVE